MGFEVENTTGSDSDRAPVNYDAYNKYMVETCKATKKKTVAGIISGIVDLGLQDQEDAKMDFTGSKEQEAAELEKFPGSWFETINDDSGGTKRVKCWKKKPVKSLAITIDIPGIIVDKAPYFTDGKESNPAPLRMILNSTFYRKEIGCVDLGRLFTLSMRKNDKTNNNWSITFNNNLYKMAVGTGVIEHGDPFLPQDITKLLGKAALFEIQVHINDKGYYNEKVKYAASLIDGMTVPDYDEELLFSTGFNANNTDNEVQFLSSPVINRIKLSSEYEGSKIKSQIERIHSYQKSENNVSEDVKEEEPIKEKTKDIPKFPEGCEPPF